MTWNGGEEDGMLGRSARMMMKMGTVILIGKDRENLTCFVYEVYVINNKIFFLSRCIFLGVVLDYSHLAFR